VGIAHHRAITTSWVFYTDPAPSDWTDTANKWWAVPTLPGFGKRKQY